MYARLFALGLLLLFAASSGCTSTPVEGPAQTKCKTNDDCAIITANTKGEDRCCWSCGAEAVTKDWAEAFEASCKNADTSGCPMYKCNPPVNPRAVCNSGTCEVETDQSP